MFASHKEASVFREGSALLHSNSSPGCDISQAVKYAAVLHINLTVGAGGFSFILDKLVQLKGKRLVNALVCCKSPQLWLKIYVTKKSRAKK